MPRWEVHISFGLMATVTLLTAVVLGLKGDNGLTTAHRAFIDLGPVILFGSAGLMVASVLPDIDGRGRIKWIIGPLVGSMLFLPALYGYMITGDLKDCIGFIRGDGSMIFLLGTAATYSSLVLPRTHRGFFHTKKAATIFGASWGIYIMIIAGMDIQSSLLIGAMASLGYLWHLSLDGEL